MTLINLKFSPDMERAIIEGIKICTTRDEPKGKPGDIFRVQNRLYRIVEVRSGRFPEFYMFYILEGFSTPDEYRAKIKQIYPKNLNDLYHVHFFAYLGDWCPQFGINGAVCSNPENLCELYQACIKSREEP